jgi:hypothetical protein
MMAGQEWLTGVSAFLRLCFLRGYCHIVAFRSAKARPFAERTAALAAQHSIDRAVSFPQITLNDAKCQSY